MTIKPRHICTNGQESPNITTWTWKGRNVDQMTRDEAIAALKLLGKMLDDERQAHAATHRFYRELRPL